jgi:hypothetical protein
LSGVEVVQVDEITWTPEHSTGAPGSITQLEQLACQQDRLLEVHPKRPLPVRA